MVGPFLWMVLGSLKPEADFLQSPPTLLPSAPTIDNFGRLFDQLDFPRFFLNSAVIALAITVGTLVFCPMLGYSLAKLRWHGKRAGDGPGPGHAHGAGRDHAHPELHPDEQPRAGEHVTRA